MHKLNVQTRCTSVKILTWGPVDVQRFDCMYHQVGLCNIASTVVASTQCQRPLYEMATDEYQPHTGHKKYDGDLTQVQETGEVASSGDKSYSLVGRNSHIC